MVTLIGLTLIGASFTAIFVASLAQDIGMGHLSSSSNKKPDK